MTKLLESIIVEESRHFIIYGQNGEERKQLLKFIADKYPIVLDTSAPVCVYIEDFGLQEITNPVKYFDKFTRSACAREYLNFCIAHQLVSQFASQINIWDAKERVDEFLKRVNRTLKEPEWGNIQSIEDLIGVLKISKEFYKEEYKNLLKLGKIVEEISDLPIPFITLNTFMLMFKKMINTNSHFSLIFDQQNQIPLISQQAINGLITEE